MRREKDHRRPRGKLLDQFQSFQSVGSRHGNVQDHHVWRLDHAHRDGFSAVLVPQPRGILLRPTRRWQYSRMCLWSSARRIVFITVSVPSMSTRRSTGVPRVRSSTSPANRRSSLPPRLGLPRGPCSGGPAPDWRPDQNDLNHDNVGSGPVVEIMDDPLAGICSPFARAWRALRTTHSHSPRVGVYGAAPSRSEMTPRCDAPARVASTTGKTLHNMTPASAGRRERSSVIGRFMGTPREFFAMRVRISCARSFDNKQNIAKCVVPAV